MFLAFLYTLFENILYRNVCIFDYLLQFTFRCFKHSLKTLLYFQNSLHRHFTNCNCQQRLTYLGNISSAQSSRGEDLLPMSVD